MKFIKSKRRSAKLSTQPREKSNNVNFADDSINEIENLTSVSNVQKLAGLIGSGCSFNASNIYSHITHGSNADHYESIPNEYESNISERNEDAALLGVRLSDGDFCYLLRRGTRVSHTIRYVPKIIKSKIFLTNKRR